MSEMENRQEGFLPRPENAVASSSWVPRLGMRLYSLQSDDRTPPWRQLATVTAGLAWRWSGNCLVKTFSAHKTKRTRGEMVH